MRIASHLTSSNNGFIDVNAIPSPERILELPKMFFSSLKKLGFLAWITLILLMCVFSNNSFAQAFEDDPFFDNEEIGFGDSGGDFQDSEFGITDDFLEPGMTEEGDPFAPMNEEEDLYIDEESFDIGTEQALQDNLFTQRELLQRERQQSIANIGYGAGTGLMIGGWSAFIAQETTTRNQWRTIGTSTVLGGVIGLLLGTRSIWDPAAPRPDMGSVETESQLLVMHETSGFKIAYSWNF